MLPSTIIQRLVSMSLLLILTITPVNAFPSTIPAPLSPATTTQLISVSSTGGLANGHSSGPTITPDGRFVAFDSWATNLVPVGYNLKTVYIRDRQTGTNELVSVSTTNEQTRGNNPAISADGRFVAFESPAYNLVPGDTNNSQDIFVRDRQSGQTERISVSSNNDQATGNSSSSAISADGHFVAFYSIASNLVTGDTNSNYDAFVRDRLAGTTELVSIASNGIHGNSSAMNSEISPDGRYVVFESMSSNLVPGDTNGVSDIFIHDRQSHTTERLSLSSQGIQGNHHSYFPSISADGRFVVFQSYANNLAPNDNNSNISDIFLRDRQTGTTELISRSLTGTSGNNWSINASISDDGRWVAFASVASNLVPNDTNGLATDIFIRDRQSGQTERVSVSTDGAQSNGASDHSHIAADGSAVVFDSKANNLVDGDTNGVDDIFLYEWIGETIPGLDLSVFSVEPLQVLEGQPLVKDKTTAIKVVIQKRGSLPADSVQVSVTIGPAVYSRFFVADDNNIDDENHTLTGDQTAYPLNFPAGYSAKTIYFFDLGLAPSGDTFQATATVKLYPDETDPNNNNLTSTLIPVVETGWAENGGPELDMIYFRTDWGLNPIGIFHDYVQYSDNYLKGVLPIAGSRYQPRSPINMTGSTASYRNFDGKLNIIELVLWMRYQLRLLRQANQTADRFISVMPTSWFRLNTTGDLTGALGAHNWMSNALVIAEARHTSWPNGPSVPAHEIGHSYGLDTDCEEYRACNPGRRDGIGNIASTGIWVEEKLPIQVPIQRNVYCFMGMYDNKEYWIDADDYQKLLNDHRVDSQKYSQSLPAQPGAILVSGMVDITGTVTLDDWHLLPEAEPDQLVDGPYSFVYLGATGDVLLEVPFDVEFRLDTGNESLNLDSTPFVFMIPSVAGTARIQIRYNGSTVAEKIVSHQAPVVTLGYPNGGEAIGKVVTIQWIGNDGDGDTLRYTVLMSPDNGATWEPLVGDLTTNDLSWDTTGLQPGQNYLIKVIATDGFNTGEDISDAPFSILGYTYLPITLRSPK